MHKITTRKPTPKEKQVIETLLKPDYASFFVLLILSCGAAWIFGKLGWWFGSFISADVAAYARIGGWGIGFALGIPVLGSLIPHARKQNKLARLDIEAQLVQDIHVKDPIITEVAMLGNNGPILAMDIGDEKILFLQGQWLYDCEIYDAEIPNDEVGDQFFNGFPNPHSFPSSEFRISRFPNTGEVLKILVSGDYLIPGDPVDALKPDHLFQPSELFNGSLDNLGVVMDREHAIRTAR